MSGHPTQAKVGLVKRNTIMVPYPGERWAEVPGWDAQVSNLGRASRTSTGTELSVHPPFGRKAPYPTFWATRDDGLARTMALHIALSMAFGGKRPRNARWTPEEDAILKASPTRAEAAKRLGRTLKSIEHHSAAIGLRWRTKEPPPPEPKRESPAAMWKGAKAAVPATLPEHLRQDLVSDMLVMRLEGDDRPWSQLYKEAYTRHNRMTGAFKERSAFDTIGGTELRLIDTFEAGTSL